MQTLEMEKIRSNENLYGGLSELGQKELNDYNVTSSVRPYTTEIPEITKSTTTTIQLPDTTGPEITVTSTAVIETTTSSDTNTTGSNTETSSSTVVHTTTFPDTTTAENSDTASTGLPATTSGAITDTTGSPDESECPTDYSKNVNFKIEVFESAKIIMPTKYEETFTRENSLCYFPNNWEGYADGSGASISNLEMYKYKIDGSIVSTEDLSTENYNEIKAELTQIYCGDNVFVLAAHKTTTHFHS